MSSRSLSLAALSCVLLISGTGCSQLSAFLPGQTSDSLGDALTDGLEEAQAAITGTDADTDPAIEPDAEADAVGENVLKAAAEASSQAEAAAKTAVTQTDWGQVSGAWNQAIAHASAVPEDSPDYGEARTKIASYKASQAQAHKAYQDTMAVRYQALTTSPINDEPPAGSVEAEGRKLRRHLQAEEFTQVNQMLRSAISANRRTNAGTYQADAILMYALAGNDVVYTTSLMHPLNKWVEAEPKNAMAYTVRSYFSQATVWPEVRIIREEYRDRDRSAAVSGEMLLTSIVDAEIALELEAKNPLALLAKLRMAKFISLPEAIENDTEIEETFLSADNVQFDPAFAAANAALPNSFEVIYEKALYLYLKDRTGKEALAYLRPLAASAPANSAVPMLIPFIHMAIANERELEQEYMQRPEVWAEVQKNSELVVAGLPEAGLYAAWYARMAQNANQGDIAKKHKQIAMQRGSDSPMVQTYLRMLL